LFFAEYGINNLKRTAIKQAKLNIALM